ncbi:hypothetical protein Hanom_Chr01g00076071 [Helianthus anomalus]
MILYNNAQVPSSVYNRYTRTSYNYKGRLLINTHPSSQRLLSFRLTRVPSKSINKLVDLYMSKFLQTQGVFLTSMESIGLSTGQALQ